MSLAVSMVLAGSALWTIAFFYAVKRERDARDLAAADKIIASWRTKRDPKGRFRRADYGRFTINGDL